VRVYTFLRSAEKYSPDTVTSVAKKLISERSLSYVRRISGDLLRSAEGIGAVAAGEILVLGVTAIAAT
jgi:hypothetical protein